MKLNNSKKSPIFKALFLLILLHCNMFVECSEAIKIHKTISKYQKLNSHSKYSSKRFTKRTSNKTRIEMKDKIKYLLIGILAGFITKAVGTTGVAEEILSSITTYCFVPAINEYNEMKMKTIKEKPCDPEVVHQVIGKKYEEIQSKCAQWETSMKLDNNEFSSGNVILEKLKGVIINNKEFDDSYDKFKKDNNHLVAVDKQYTKIYKPIFEKLKDDRSPNVSEKARNVAKILFDEMDSFISSKTMCEALRDCSPLEILDHLKIIWGTSLGFLKCSATAPIKGAIIHVLKEAVTKIFNILGVSILTTIAAGIFPGILLVLLTKFIITNWSALQQFYESYFKLKIDDPNAANAERDLWNSIGRLIGGLLYGLIGAKKRKLKKFRKFDTNLF